MVSKSEALGACKECQKAQSKNKFIPGCIITDIEASKDEDISAPPCVLSFLSLISDQRSPESKKEPLKTSSPHDKTDKIDEKTLTSHDKTSTPYEDGQSKIRNCSQNSTFRQSNSSMYKEDRKTLREQLDLAILRLIALVYSLSAISRILKVARTTIMYRVRKFEERGLVKPSGKSNTRSYPKFYDLTTAGTEFLIHNEGASTPYDKPFNYSHHAVSFKAEWLGGARPRGDHTYHPKGWDGEVFYYDGYKIRLTPNYAIVDIHEDLGADTEANLLLKYHTLAQTYLQKFSAQHNIQLSLVVQQNREPHRAIPGSHKQAQEMLGSMGGELYDKETGLQGDESDKNHKGELEFVGKKGAETSERFLHLVNQGPEILATTRATAEDAKAKVDSFDKVLHSNLQEIKADLREIKTEIKEIPAHIKLQQKEQEIEELSARLQEYESHAPEKNAGKFERQPKEWDPNYG